MEKHKIAIVVGSLRKELVNRKVAQAMCSIAADRLDCTIVEIGNLALFNQDIEANPPAEWVALQAGDRRRRRHPVRHARI